MPRAPRWWTAIAAAAFLAALADAIRLRWVCDDAFISFRYARNLVHGHGLVFNVGEAVEGYTNFSWTLGTALGLVLGVDPIAWTWCWSIAAWAGIAVLLAAHAHEARRWPIAALAWVAVPYGRMFATSGLETAAFALLLTATVLAARSERIQTPIHAAGVGLLGALAVMTRPEGGLVLLAGPLLLGLRNVRLGLTALTASVMLVAPWLVFKLAIYGDLLPNTWYAKAGAGPRWHAGMGYLLGFFGPNAVIGLGLLGWLTPAKERQRKLQDAVVITILAIYLLHVARTGGDFMYSRFCIPILPLLALGLERGVVAAADRVKADQLQRLWLAASVLIPLGVALAPVPPELFSDVDTDKVGMAGVVDERSWYPPETVTLARAQGAVLADCVAKLDVRVVYYGTQAMLMYYSDLPYALEPHVGLTDHALARMPSPEGKRVGHGQKADTAYLRQREIDLAFGYRLQLPTTDITRLRLPGGVSGRILTYRRDVMAGVRACGGRFMNFERFLDQWVAQLDETEDAEVAKAWKSFSAYYFDHNDDPVREDAFRKRLGLPLSSQVNRSEEQGGGGDD